MKTHLLVLPVALCVACAASTSGGDDPGTAGDVPEAGDVSLDVPEAGDVSLDVPVDPGADVGPIADIPILLRSPVLTHACAETLPPTRPTPDDWNVAGLALDGGQAWVGRLADRLGVSTIGLDGTLGEAVEVEAEPYTSFSADVAVSAGRALLAWGEYQSSGSQSLRAALVADGKVAVAPFTLAGSTSAVIGTPSVVPAPDGGFGLAWIATDGSATTSVRFVRLDAQGAVVAGPVDVDSFAQAYGASGAVLAAAGEGFALAWTRSDGQGNSEVWFARIDADGIVSGQPQRVSPAAGGGWNYRIGGWRTGGSPLLADGDRVWLAYTSAYFNGDYTNSEGWTTVTLVVVSAAGDIARHALQPAENGVTATDATLFRLDGKLGVLWSEGTMIYICGGCFADNDLKLVLVDPDAIVPASEVATHAHADHGYVGPAAVVVGSDVLSVSSQDFHALSFPAVAVMTCVAKGAP